MKIRDQGQIGTTNYIIIIILENNDRFIIENNRKYSKNQFFLDGKNVPIFSDIVSILKLCVFGCYFPQRSI